MKASTKVTSTETSTEAFVEESCFHGSFHIGFRESKLLLRSFRGKNVASTRAFTEAFTDANMLLPKRSN